MSYVFYGKDWARCKLAYFVVRLVVFRHDTDDVVFGALGNTRDEVTFLVLDDVEASLDVIVCHGG